LVSPSAVVIAALLGVSSHPAAAPQTPAHATARISSADATATPVVLAANYLAQGELHPALREYERVLALRERDGERSALIDTLLQLASVSIQLQQLDRAREYLDRVRALSNSSVDDLVRARTLELTGLLERWESRYTDALRDVDAAIELRNRHHSNDPANVVALQVRGDAFMLMGDVAAAQRAWTEAFELARSTVGLENRDGAEVLRRLGLAAFAVGNLQDARRFREEGLQIAQSALGPCDRALTSAMGAAATSRQYDGQYADARSLLRRAQRTMESCSARDPRPPDARATIVNNEAELEEEVGDLPAAERLYSQAIDVWSKALGAGHPFVARGIDRLAQVVARRGQITRARTLYTRALAIRRQALGPTHPQVGFTLANLAATEMDVRNYTMASRHIDDAIALYRQTGASDEPDHLARMLELRAKLAVVRGDVAAARTSMSEALTERERVFGPTHPLTSDTRAGLARLDFMRGDTSHAVDEALMAERNGRDHLRYTLRYLPERQALAYAGRRTRALDVLLSSGIADPAARVTALDELVQSRGVLLDEFAARARSTAATGGDLRGLRDEAQSARMRFANLVVRSLREPVDRQLLDAARQRKEEAERALAERSADARAEAARTAAGIREVREALPPGTAVVSFVRYERVQPSTATQRTSVVRPSYGAFVLRADAVVNEAVFIPLGSAATIEQRIRAWKAAVTAATAAQSEGSDPERDYRQAGSLLRTTIWDPIAPHLATARRAFIVPDGLLNVVNIAALPSRNAGRYLVEEPVVMHYLSTERDLLATPRATSSSALIVGRPAFETTSVRVRTANATRSGCDATGTLHFDDLPGTGREALDVSRLWQAEGGSHAEVLTGAAATETALKRSLADRRVVHLATHGFFLSSGCAPGRSNSRGVGGLVSADAIAAAELENPLLLSGLAMAGANRSGRRSVDQDDGILTAEEIAGLDLRDTEWAVLSACDTGLGEIRAGEGVFGLRRAFQIAGARTVIMSLWSVDDEATRVWMRALYNGRLARRLDTADAVREASLSVLRQRRAAHQSTHPFYWAAFVAAGDWR
jgi:CHAT domain-containing protein/predicted negative regulator of RcsB-dependent stress response